ncbi:hypothetical protein [Paenibacillus naphthalenovorans]|uniref:Uncharacterized protein n=1 Tax=Paenibacillus naphthalenovorans TaxID=162209 RepID=A0A0U2UK38_9BACL|nr:hypothetical protein [Paenibacillus naphthalenovorans]ALS22305.1 hypothetical protein IJ22_19310 [Paenibacillus naphthalenovorans]
MATSYELIFKKFIKKLKNDENFFNYKNLTDEEVEEMINDHLNSLLDRSVSFIYKFGNPDINLYDRNDELQEFNVDLVNQEIDLLSDLMYFSYFEEQKNKVTAFELTFRSSELNVFSPSNERRTVLNMISDLENSSVDAIQNYLSRDRITWNYKSIYGSGSS